MSEARVLPLLGALLGVLLGLVTMALLTVLGIIAPDRLPLFALVGLGAILGAALLTQRIALAKKRLVSMIVVGALFVGVSLTGIPEVVRGGSMTAGCTVTGTSSLETTPVTPAQTSAIDGFSVTPTDTVEWTTQTAVPVTAASGTVSLLVGGIGIPLRDIEFAEAPDATTWSGQSAVEDQLAAMKDATGFDITGIYHVQAHLDIDQGECAGDAYLHVAPDNAFAAPLLTILWAMLGVLVIALLVLLIVVRKTIRESDRSLAMVGISAIPGETSTDVPTSAPSPVRAPQVSEPTQPTVPDTDGDKTAEGDERIGKGEQVSGEPAAGDVPAEGDERIGKGTEETKEGSDEGRTDHP